MTALTPGAWLGIVGGGQLGRMLAMAAARFGLKVHIYDPDPHAPAKDVSARTTQGAFDDEDALQSFARSCDAVTFEFENIPLHTLETVAQHTALRPSTASLRASQDRLEEKRFLQDLGIDVAPYAAIDNPDAMQRALIELGGQGILKTRRLGYDGKGQVALGAEPFDPFKVWTSLGAQPLILEQRVPFAAELSALVARSVSGDMRAYDCPINVHRNGILDTSSVGLFAKPQPSTALQKKAQEAAMHVAQALDHVGILTVEFFAVAQDQVIANEIAPRVHNSGHWTMEACVNSQFDNHVRAVAGWPLGPTDRFADAQMTNLLGEDGLASDLFKRAADDAAVSVHLYGKSEARPGRKMGHLTRLAPRQNS